jgi:hypothetical protein
MPTIQVEANVSPRELLRAAEQLTPPELDSFVADILALRSRRTAPCLSATEAELLGKINRGLPDELRRRFEALKARRQAETLTPQEQAELLGLTDQVEQQEVERLQALSTLAQLRKTTLGKLMDELGLQAPAHE